jgi:hypothetical protein
MVAEASISFEGDQQFESRSLQRRVERTRPGAMPNSAGLRGRGYAAFTGRYGRPRTGRAGQGTQGHQRRVGAGAISGVPRRYRDSP